ncbi:hypothetical protein [Heyndrickxia sporothermodurans]
MDLRLMRAPRFLAAAAALLIAVLPVRADQILPQGRIVGTDSANGDILFGALKLGKRQGGKTLFQPDAIQIQGPGSTGQIDGMTAAPDTSATRARSMAERAGDFVNLLDYGPVYFGKTITAAQAAANTQAFLLATNRAIQRNAKGVWMPGEDIVVAIDPARQQPPLHPGNPNGFLYVGNGTKLWAYGTDRSNMTGIALFEGCKGTCGFMGDVTLDVLNPLFDQGVVTAVTGTYIEVALDWAPTWSDAKIIYTIKDDTPYAYTLKAGNANALDAGVKLTNTTGLTYRIDLTGSNGVSPSYLDTSVLAVGTEVVIQHQAGGPGAITAAESDQLVVPPGLVINGGNGSALYAAETPVRWLGRVEAPMVSTPRGYIRKRLAVTADALHITSGGGGAGTYIGGSIADTADDSVNLISYIGPVQSRVDATHLQVTVGPGTYGFPKLGHEFVLLDGGRADQGTFRVTGISGTLAPSATMVLTVDRTLPTGIDTTWEITNATLSRGYEIAAGFTAKRSRAAGIRTSGRNTKIGPVFISETMGPGFTNTTYGDTEYAPASDSQMGPFTMRRVNYGKGDERQAALVFAPTRLNGTAVTKGAAGRLRIAGIDVVDTNGPVMAVDGVDQLSVGYLRGTNVNLSPSGFDGFTGGFAQVVNSGQVEIGSASLFGTTPLPFNLSGVDRFRMRSVTNVTAPTTGATTIDADTGAAVAYMPTLSSLNGQPITTASATASYSVKDKVATIYWSASITTAGGAAGSYLVLSTPAGLVSAAGATGTGRESAQLGIGLVPVISANVPAFAVYGGGNQPTIGNGYLLSGTLSFPLP